MTGFLVFGLKLTILSVLALIFSLWGWASFWVDWSLCLFYLRSTVIIKTSETKPTTSACESKSTRLRGLCVIISLPVPWVCWLCQCASMPEVCQHARGSSWSVWASLDEPESPRCPEGQGMVPLCQLAQNPQDWTYGTIFTWNDDICIVLPLMWWPFGCGYCHSVCSLHTVGLVLTNTKFSLLTHLYVQFTHVIHSILMSENGFVNFSNFA